jgi:hypothetical protein
MRRMSILICGLAVLAVGASAARAQDSLESQVNTRLSQAAALSLSEVKPNEIARGNVVFSGIAVDILKTDSLPQLFNPLAPDKYGSAEDNALLDLITERPSGWKLFSIRF